MFILYIAMKKNQRLLNVKKRRIVCNANTPFLRLKDTSPSGELWDYMVAVTGRNAALIEQLKTNLLKRKQIQQNKGKGENRRLAGSFYFARF